MNYVAILGFYSNKDELGNYRYVTKIELHQKAKNETEALNKIVKRAETLAKHPSIAKEYFFVESFIEKVDKEN